MRPFGVASFNDSLPDPPPSTSSEDYALGYNQVYAVGALNSTLRTEDETSLVFYWAAKNSANRWFDVCLALAAAYNTTFEQNLVLYTMVSIAQTDATLASFEHKVQYMHWRPVTGPYFLTTP